MITQPEAMQIASMGISTMIELDAVRKERDQLRSFAQEIMEGWPDVGTLDGFDLQELAVKHGLIVATIRHKPCSEEYCSCAEMVDERDWKKGVDCYHATTLLKGAL